MRAVSKGKAVVTGAESDPGATYADRLARRGHDLILVTRTRANIDQIADKIRQETKQAVEIVAADLNSRAELRGIEKLLRADSKITALVNCAGASAASSLLLSDIGRLDTMIALNVTAIARLTHAALPGLVARGGGTIINLSSVPGSASEVQDDVYGGTRAFVLAFSLSLHQEFHRHNMRIQAVLPNVSAAGLSARCGGPIKRLPAHNGMPAHAMVDAALAGFDRGEVFTTPALTNVVDWQAYTSARRGRVKPGSSELRHRALRVPAGTRHFFDEKHVDGALEGF